MPLGGDRGLDDGDKQKITQYLSTGAAWAAERTPTIFKPFDLASSAAEQTIWTPAAGKKFRLMGFLIQPGSAQTLTLRDGTGGTTIFVCKLSNTSPGIVLGNGILSALANNLLTAQLGGAATLTGTVWGTEE